MQFKLSAVMLANLLTVLAAATPTNKIPAPQDGLVLSDTVETTDGTLSFYVSGPDSVTVTKRATCGPATVFCSNSYLADINVCNALLNSIRSSDRVLDDSTRSVCLSTEDTCCISWGANVEALHVSNLVPGATNILNTCSGYTTSGFASGLARTINLQGGCVVGCLSNRAKDCPSK